MMFFSGKMIIERHLLHWPFLVSITRNIPFSIEFLQVIIFCPRSVKLVIVKRRKR